MKHTFDVVIIGGGSAGLTAAMEALNHTRRVALVERSGRYGGTCRYVGCTPSKTLLHTAQVLHHMRRHAAVLGLPTVDPDWDFKAVMRHKDDIVLRAGGDDGYDAPSDFRKGGGTTFTGDARFQSPTELAVGADLLSAERFIIATGSRPRIPPIEGLADAGFLTWETIFDLDALPESLAIIGGGPLAVEFGQIFGRFGSKVTLIEAEDEILPQAEPEVACMLREVLEAEGVRFHPGAEIGHVRRDGTRRVVVLKDRGRTEITGAQLLVAAGTQPNTDQLSLEAAGVELTDKGAIKVDEHLRTTARGIYACGDVATRYQFTHVALYEAKLAVANALGGKRQSVDERVVPWAVYTDPALAHVGLSEREAREQFDDIVVASVQMEEIERSLVEEAPAGLAKLIARKSTGELVGAEILCAGADNLIHEAALAIHKRLKVRDIAETLHAYPTYAEALQKAAEQLVERSTTETRSNRD